MKLRIGIDVGGTFTDVTAFDEDQGEIIFIRKYLSDPAEPMRVMETITGELAAEFGEDSVSLVLHGSTAALNTLLEERGVRVGLLTTLGFRDVYEIGRSWRGEDVFNFFAPAPKMFLTRDRIHEVEERLDHRGDVVAPFVASDVVRAVRKLVEDGVESVAICFLFSYTNPAHEQEAARIVSEIAPDLYVSLSSDVNPEWREYERTASTVANAYIGPPVSRYLKDLEVLTSKRFRQARVLMMKSDGGAASAAMLASKPIQTVMSGPVAGVIGARYLGDVKGIEKLISFDAGGTSSDMAVIPGRPLFKSEVTVGRHPLRTNTVDIETIGAGGGSIASVQLGGVLKVGPASAGANPGPACYGRDGGEATLTDALVVLGHLNPDALLQGAMPIDSDKAREAVIRHVADPLAMSAVEAAWGVLTVLITNCMVAMRTITVERGYDPREFTLIPFGGMGPTIAGRIAAEIGIGQILIPRDPGAFSAYGMLVTDVRQESSFTRITPLDGVDCETLESVFEGLERTVTRALLDENIPHDRLKMLRTAGMRYRGQSYEVAVPVSELRSPEALSQINERFHDAHLRRYGHMAQNEAVEIVTFRVVGVGAISKPKMRRFAAGSGRPSPVGTRQAHFGPNDAIPVPVYHREGLEPGAEIQGPAIIEEKTSTIVLYPGQSARVDEYQNIAVSVGNHQAARND
jgi:N-methylhydantoinase A